MTVKLKPMTESNQNETDRTAIPEEHLEPKKPYQKPAFRHERVFETMALTCGKVQTTQGQCHYNRKNS